MSKEKETKAVETEADTEFVTVYKPIKDLNGMTSGFTPVKVPKADAEFKLIPGGLAASPKY